MVISFSLEVPMMAHLHRPFSSAVRNPWLSLRSGLLMLLVSTTLLFAPGEAEAGKKGKGGGKQAAGHVELTGNKSFDTVFRQLKNLDQAVSGAERSRKSGRHNVVVAMGLPKDATLPKAIAHLKTEAAGKVKVKMSGGKPTLEPSDALPDKVKAEIEAVNGALHDYVDAIKHVAHIPKESAQLVKKAKAFPNEIKAELTSNPLEAITILRSVGTIKDNLKIAAKLPKRATVVTKQLNTDIKVIVSAFGGKWPPI